MIFGIRKPPSVVELRNGKILGVWNVRNENKPWKKYGTTTFQMANIDKQNTRPNNHKIEYKKTDLYSGLIQPITHRKIVVDDSMRKGSQLFIFQFKEPHAAVCEIFAASVFHNIIFPGEGGGKL